MTSTFIRPRLVLLTTALADGEAGASALEAALAAGDVASVIIEPAGRSAAAFQDFAERLVPIAQAAGAAAIVADDTRCAGRVKADGLHLSTGGVEAVADALARFAPKLIVGCSGFETRHAALEAGERLPDYLLFGRFGGDREAEPHEANLALAEWWAEIVEVPAIVLAGADVESARTAALTGAEFVALSAAVFAEPANAPEKVRRANAILDSMNESVAT